MYIPEQGNIIFLDFDPRTGHEQKGRRPAIVVSNNTFINSKNGPGCPVTNTNKGFPFSTTGQTNQNNRGYHV